MLKRATPDTRFYIDYDWWDRSDLDLKTYLLTRLDIGEDINLESNMDEVDLVDAATGEVTRVDGFQYVIQAYFNQLPDDFVTRTSLVDAVFCVLLANANKPMTALEIAQKVKRPPETILKTMGGPKVYQGVRPILDE
jgi:methyltransferase-like protein